MCVCRHARCLRSLYFCSFFFFNDTATTEIYPLSLHDALPISGGGKPRRRLQHAPAQLAERHRLGGGDQGGAAGRPRGGLVEDRKSTRLNSSHGYISYAVFCLKKKKASASLRSRRTTSSRCSLS